MISSTAVDADREKARKLLVKFEYKKNLYLLGCTASLLNIHAQQQRAFNLVWALQKDEVLEKDLHVAVVGAGIGGLTLTAALLAAGAKVTLFERKANLMHVQQGCTTRYVHPNVATWPEDGYGYPLTHMPYMNWRAGTSDSVIQQLSVQWDAVASVFKSTLEVLPETVIVSLRHDSDQIEINPSKGQSKRFPIVVLAVGYGIEQLQMSTTPSYWRNDDLAQSILGGKEKPKHFIVCGAGDGALIDVLRLKLTNFQHHTFIRDVIHQQWVKDAAKTASSKAWKDIWKGEDPAKLREKVSKHFGEIRKDTEVLLCNRRDEPFESEAQILHKVCVSLLFEVDDKFHYKKAELDSVRKSKRGVYQVRLKQPRPTDKLRLFWWTLFGKHHRESMETGGIVQRIGTTSEIGKLLQLTESDVRKLRQQWTENDQKKPETWNQENYGTGFLADAFQQVDYVDAYEIGVIIQKCPIGAPMTAKINATMKKIHELLAVDFDEAKVAPVHEGNKSDDVQWGGRTFNLRLEHIELVKHGAHNKTTLTQGMTQRTHTPEKYQCLVMRTTSKHLLEHLLHADTLQYHIYRIFLKETFPVPRGKMDYFVNTDTRVYLVNLREANESVEVHCIEGMYQAHQLMTIPTLVDLFSNTWKLNLIQGFGWATKNTFSVNRIDQRGNELVGM